MSELRGKLNELFNRVCAGGAPPAPARFMIAEVGPKDFKGAHPVIDRSKLQDAEQYAERFRQLLGAGYAWLNLSYYGLIGQTGLVVVELPGAAPRPEVRSPRTSVNLSGPVMAVADANWDATAFVVLVGEEPDSDDHDGGGSKHSAEPTAQAVNKGESTMPTTGEKPGKGTYKCKKCGQLVTLDDDTDTLPPCPKCEHTEYDKVA